MAIKEEKIKKEIKKTKEIKLIHKNIEYKEGVLEFLEKNKKINFIIISENLPGQIEITELMEKIKIKNKKINLIVLSEQPMEEWNQYANILESKNFKIKQLLKLMEINIEKSQLKNSKKNPQKIVQVIGNTGAGKTIFTFIFAEILAQKKNKKILIIDNDIEKESLTKFYGKEKIEKEMVTIKPNLFLLSVKKLNQHSVDEINYYEKIKNNFQYILIDSENKYYFKNKKIININIFIFEPNILELNKINKKILKINNLKIILNKFNSYSIDTKVIQNIFPKIKIKKIKYNKKINKIINENSIECLNKKEKEVFMNLLK